MQVLCSMFNPGMIPLYIIEGHSLTNCSSGRPPTSHARPRTPTRSSSAISTAHLGRRSGNSIASPPRQPYPGIMTDGADEWSRDPAEEDDDDDDDEIVYDDDEDEFGLPSLASMRRKKSAPLKPKAANSSGGAGSFSTLGYGLSASNRQRADSADIAEERGAPMYPTARKGEGKILRPQYKDILQGIHNPMNPWRRGRMKLTMARSRECFEPHQPLTSSHRCFSKGERHSLQSHHSNQQIQAHSAGQHSITYRVAGSCLVRCSGRSATNDLATSSRIPSY